LKGSICSNTLREKELKENWFSNLYFERRDTIHFSDIIELLAIYSEMAT